VTKNAVAGVLYRAGAQVPKVPLRSLDERLNWARVTEPGCRWISGHPPSPDWTWCGAQQLPGRPYCAWHEKVARYGSRNTGNPIAATPAAANGLETEETLLLTREKS
jgi:GcrA cell cycle regulator